MYVSETRNCVNVSFTFNKTKVAEQALLDSGATDNFIDQRTVERLHIPTRRSSDLACSATFSSKVKLTLTQFLVSLTYMVRICEAWAGAVDPSSFKNPNRRA